MRAPALLAPLLLAACVGAPPADAPDAAAPRFPVAAFFAGETRGEGVLRIAMHHARAIHVVGHGHVEPDGTLVVDQRVTPEGDRSHDREWRIREIAPGRYAGTLSDASGAVGAVATPGRLSLAFRMRSGVQAEQRLTLAPDGRSAHNIMIVRKFGMRVAVLDETIRKLD